MSAGSRAHPPADAWVAAVHASEYDFKPRTAVVVDASRLLTCAHVVASKEGVVREPLWVSFLKAPDPASCPRRRVASWTLAHDPPVRDLAVLILDEDVPAGIEAAPLRFSPLTWSASGGGRSGSRNMIRSVMAQTGWWGRLWPSAGSGWTLSRSVWCG